MITENNAIEVRNLTKYFKLEKSRKIFGKLIKSKNFDPRSIMAIENVSFEVKKGEMLGIIGLNGSGKTTLLRTIAGIYRPNSGTVITNGTVAPILQIGTGFHEQLDARENIMMYGMLLGIPKSEIKEKIKNIIEFSELEEFVDVKLKRYSAGMRARLAFSTTFEINPDILLIDEVLAVGDRRFKEKCFMKFASFKKNGKTILYTTHSLERVYKLIDRLLVLHHGKVVTIGKPDDASKKYDEIIKSINSKNSNSL